MSSHIKTMTQGNPGKLILTFALPLMAGNVFQQLYTVVDTMVVGKYLGVGALAALGASDWMNWMMLGIVQGFAQGFAIRMAQDFGAGKYDSLRKVIGNSCILALLSSLALVLIGQLTARPVLGLLQTPDDIMGSALLYLRIMFLGLPIVMAYNLFASILRSLGDGQTPLRAMVVASITNIVLDLLFVLAFHWGIAGAAAATLIAQLVSGFFCLYHIHRIEILQMSASDFQMEGVLGGKLMALGFPMAFQNCIIAIGGMIVQFVVNGFGVLFIAGFTATNKLYGILEIAATSYGYAMITYVGQNLGAKKLDRIHSGMRCAVAVAVATSVVIGTVMIFAGRGVVSLFISGTEAQVAEATEAAYRYLAVMSACLPVLYILHVTRSAVQGAGDTVLPMVSGIAEFFMRTGGVLLLPPVLGGMGIFVAEVLAWLGADLILVPSYFITMSRITKKEKNP